MAGLFHPGLFAGRVALVTGGGTGIGRAVAQQLVELGATVTIAARREAPLLAAAAALSAAGPGRCDWTRCDIRREEDVTATVDTVLSRHGRLDFLVNNGGGQFLSPAADISRRGWHAVVETNLTGTFALTQAAYRAWLRDHGGAVVSVVADMFRGFPLMAHTGASRAGVENLTRTLAVEWAADGVRVNAVAPSVIFSPTAAANYSVDVFGAAAAELPARRCGTTHEVAAAVCFLLSPGASYVSGATLRVDAASSLYSRHLVRVPPHERLPPYRGDAGPAVAEGGFAAAESESAAAESEPIAAESESAAAGWESAATKSKSAAAEASSAAAGLHGTGSDAYRS